jgi:hypothetical protein
MERELIHLLDIFCRSCFWQNRITSKDISVSFSRTVKYLVLAPLDEIVFIFGRANINLI